MKCETNQNIKVSDEQIIKAFCIFYNAIADAKGIKKLDEDKTIDNYHKNYGDKQAKAI